MSDETVTQLFPPYQEIVLGDKRERVYGIYSVLDKSFGNVLVRKLGEYSLDKTTSRWLHMNRAGKPCSESILQ